MIVSVNSRQALLIHKNAVIFQPGPIPLLMSVTSVDDTNMR